MRPSVPRGLRVHRIVDGADAQMDRKLKLSADAPGRIGHSPERAWNLPRVRLELIALILALEQIRHVRPVNEILPHDTPVASRTRRRLQEGQSHSRPQAPPNLLSLCEI